MQVSKKMDDVEVDFTEDEKGTYDIFPLDEDFICIHRLNKVVYLEDLTSLDQHASYDLRMDIPRKGMQLIPTWGKVSEEKVLVLAPILKPKNSDKHPKTTSRSPPLHVVGVSLDSKFREGSCRGVFYEPPRSVHHFLGHCYTWFWSLWWCLYKWCIQAPTRTFCLRKVIVVFFQKSYF